MNWGWPIWLLYLAVPSPSANLVYNIWWAPKLLQSEQITVNTGLAKNKACFLGSQPGVREEGLVVIGRPFLGRLSSICLRNYNKLKYFWGRNLKYIFFSLNSFQPLCQKKSLLYNCFASNFAKRSLPREQKQK